MYADFSKTIVTVLFSNLEFICVFHLPSTAKQEDIKLSVRKLLNRHSIVFGDYTWTEFDDPFLTRNVQSVAIVDTELKVKDPQVSYC